MKLSVQDCPTCNTPWVKEAIAAGAFGGICPTCSDTGQVIGVPKGQIVVADGDTRRGLMFSVKSRNESLARVHVESLTNIRAVPAAVVNLIMQEIGGNDEN